MEENVEVVELNDTPDVEQVDTTQDVSSDVADSQAVATEAKTGRAAMEEAYDKLTAKEENKEDRKELPPLSEQKEAAEAKVNKGLDPAGRGPNSWKATVREKFKTLPADVQQEVLRRENEHQKLMQETTNERRFAGEFMQATAPYEAFLRSNNIHPLNAYKQLMNDAYTLKTGDAITKGRLVAAIIKNNNVDLDALNNALEGISQPVDPVLQELNALKAKFAERETYEQRTFQSQIDNELAAFANNPENEFFADVRQDMAILLDAGRATDLKDAYDKACFMNPEVRSVIQQRTQTRQTPMNDVSTQQRIAAASSVKGAPATTRPSTPKRKLSSREAMEAAWEELVEKRRS